MTKITALVETHNDERRLARLLETLRATDQIVVVDHRSSDSTLQIARTYGATICTDAGIALASSANDWVLVVRPDEGIHESFEASLLEWKTQAPDSNAYAVEFLEADSADKRTLQAEVRFAHRTRAKWKGLMPNPGQPHSHLAGLIARYSE